jgi:ankyrin repeat protein
MNVARLLVEHGASVSARDEDKSTPLHIASARGHTDLARFPIGRGADVSAEDKRVDSAVFGIERGHMNLARWLIEHATRTAQTTLRIRQPTSTIK